MKRNKIYFRNGEPIVFSDNHVARELKANYKEVNCSIEGKDIVFERNGKCVALERSGEDDDGIYLFEDDL